MYRYFLITLTKPAVLACFFYTFVVFYLEKVSKTQSLSWAEINLSHQPDYDDVILSTRFASWDLVLDKIWWTFVAFPNNHPLRA